MSNQVKHWIKLIALSVAVLIPFGVVLGLAAFAAPVYGQTFLGELAPKFERLNTVEEPKVVIVGGSSVAFGLDSELLSAQIGMPVVNFGLYATLGTKIMMDLSKSNIGAGDIVVLAPEMDEQTLSLYFNAEAALQGMEGDWSMLRYIPSEDRSDLVGGLYEYVTAKVKYSREGLLDSAGVYNRDSFNAFGDIVYERPYNTMLLGYDPTKSIMLTSDLFDPAFVDYINEYTAWCEKQGATVYFSFCPMNASAMSSANTEDSLFEFYKYLYETLDCEVIGNVNDYIIDEDYFYDSNFHLNDSGVILRTSLLAHELNRVRGITQHISIEIPAPPERPVSQEQIAQTDALLASYFTYAEYATGYAITGVSEAGKALDALTVPASYEGKAVLAIEKGAFDGCDNLTKLTINENIIQLMDGAFSGAANLAKIYVNRPSAEGLGVGDGAFDGAAPGVKMVLTTQESFESFVADYFWSKYGEYMILEKQ